jgi:hypothetical protein
MSYDFHIPARGVGYLGLSPAVGVPKTDEPITGGRGGLFGHTDQDVDMTPLFTSHTLRREKHFALYN